MCTEPFLCFVYEVVFYKVYQTYSFIPKKLSESSQDMVFSFYFI